MQRNVLQERHPNLPGTPLLSLKPNKNPVTQNGFQLKDTVLTPVDAAGGTDSSVLPHPPNKGVVNVGYGADSKEKEVTKVVETLPSEDVSQATPNTPLKSASKPATPPLTPLANLKVLIAAASTAREQESEQHEEEGTVKGEESESRGAGEESRGGKEGEDGGGRKMKSLAILCKKFLTIADSEIGVGTDFSLESMCKKLGTNRRRIYDIINVLEALEMIVKQSKNWYTWLGQGSLLVTLAKMRAMAEDDLDFRQLLFKENPGKENVPPSPSLAPAAVATGGLASLDPPCKLEIDGAALCGGPEDGGLAGGQGSAGGRWDKSLGVLCQKFIMLFLVTPENEVTLDFAGNILMPDDTSFPLQPTNPKTKVRRLYDIANVLTTLGLIRKKTFLAPNHRKMPGYSWAGPSIAEIQEISVCRKSEFNLYPFYPKKKGGGVPLTRKPSFGNPRPFLHQYEVKGHVRSNSCGPNSAPSSPMKMKGSGFKRSLSFGAGTKKLAAQALPIPPPHVAVPPQQAMETAAEGVSMCATPISQVPAKQGSKRVFARQLTPTQQGYLQEVKEFEAELQKHTHKYPHVAPVFSEFVTKFLTTLEQAATAPQQEATPTDVTPTILCSPPFSVSPSKLASSFFPPPISPLGMSPSGSGTTTPLAPPTSTQSPQLLCLENAVASHAHHSMPSTPAQNRGVSRAANSAPGGVMSVPSPVETSTFNPSSLLVSAATNGGFPLFSTHPYLPLSCYSLPTPTSAVMSAGVKMGPVSMPPPPTMVSGVRLSTTPPSALVPGVKVGTVRSLAPKPIQTQAKTDESETSPSKRLRLDQTLN